MYALTLLSTLLVSVSAMPALVPRDEGISANTIMTDIHGISTSVYKLRTDLSAYNGGNYYETSIPADFNAVQEAAKKGQWDCEQRLWNFTQGESQSINHYLGSTLGNDIPGMIHEFKGKSEHFGNSGHRDNIANSLQWLSYEYSKFSTALGKKLSTDDGQQQHWHSRIHNSFEEGISHYGGRGGYGGHGGH